MSDAAQAVLARHRWTAMLSTTGVSLAGAGVALVVNILMARELGPSSRGQVALVLQSSYLVAPLLAWGLDRQALRGDMGAPPQTRHLWVATIVLAAVAGLAGSLVALACVCVAAYTGAITIERGVGMARRSLVRFVVVYLLAQAWILAASTTLYLAHVDDVTWWLAVYVAPAPVLLGLAILDWTRRKGPTTGPSRTSFVYMLGGVSSMLAGRVDRLLLPVLSSTHQLGLYMAIATASEMIAWAARGLGESRVSDYVDRELTRAQLAHLAVKDLWWFGLAAVPVAVGLFLVVVPLLGPSFSASRTLVIPLCAASAAWCVYLQMSSRWLGAGSATRSVSLDLATTAVTTVLVCILVPFYDALGAALACLVAYSVMSVVAVALAPRGASRTTT